MVYGSYPLTYFAGNSIGWSFFTSSSEAAAVIWRLGIMEWQLWQLFTHLFNSIFTCLWHIRLDLGELEWLEGQI